MRSDTFKKGVVRAPHRSLLKALGLTDEEIGRPIIGIASSANEIIPGHMHLKQISDAAKAGIWMAGGTPMEFSTIGICDGIAMDHKGMNFSLPSRELIADSIELVANGQIRVGPLISALAPLADGPQWFDRLYAREPGLMKVVLQPS